MCLKEGLGSAVFTRSPKIALASHSVETGAPFISYRSILPRVLVNLVIPESGTAADNSSQSFISPESRKFLLRTSAGVALLIMLVVLPYYAIVLPPRFQAASDARSRIKAAFDRSEEIVVSWRPMTRDSVRIRDAAQLTRIQDLVFQTTTLQAERIENVGFTMCCDDTYIEFPCDPALHLWLSSRDTMLLVRGHDERHSSWFIFDDVDAKSLLYEINEIAETAR